MAIERLCKSYECYELDIPPNVSSDPEIEDFERWIQDQLYLCRENYRYDKRLMTECENIYIDLLIRKLVERGARIVRVYPPPRE